MGGNVYRMSEAQHDAYKARRAAQTDQMKAALIGGVAKPVLETGEPSNTRAAEATSGTPIPDAAARPPSKYGNVKTDGYDSKKEAARAFVLRLMQEAGEIRALREKQRWLLIPPQDGERPCHYESDFEYEEFASGTWRFVVEDCKGMRTPEYRIKRKLMLFVHGIHIKET